MLKEAVMHTSVVAATMLFIVHSGLLDGIHAEVGFEEYAERRHPHLYHLPDWVEMPANTLVNIGYLVVGLIWLVNTYQAEHTTKKLRSRDAYMFYVFSLMSMIYAFIQFTRIVTQTHRSAILDQWVTLPIFCWVVCWCEHVKLGLNVKRNIYFILVSCSSYALALLAPTGFEVALACHIVTCAVVGWHTYQKYKTAAAFRALCGGLIMCVGFVVLKLLDHKLAWISVFFRHLTGHFWSKVCDFLQIHFVFEFFTEMVEQKYKLSTRK